MLIIGIQNGKPGVADKWLLSEPLPKEMLFGQEYKY
jgi:hypothetical protein